MRVLAALVFLAFGLGAIGGNIHLIGGGVATDTEWRRVFHAVGGILGLFLSLSLVLGGIGLLRPPGRLEIFTAGSGVLGFSLFVASLAGSAMVEGTLRWVFLVGGILIGVASVVALRRTLFRKVQWGSFEE
jgi:hypothetical protein